MDIIFGSVTREERNAKIRETERGTFVRSSLFVLH